MKKCSFYLVIATILLEWYVFTDLNCNLFFSDAESAGSFRSSRTVTVFCLLFYQLLRLWDPPLRHQVSLSYGQITKYFTDLWRFVTRGCSFSNVTDRVMAFKSQSQVEWLKNMTWSYAVAAVLVTAESTINNDIA